MRGITPLLERWLGNLLARQFEGEWFSLSSISRYFAKGRSCVFLFCPLPLFETENPFLLDYL